LGLDLTIGLIHAIAQQTRKIDAYIVAIETCCQLRRA